MLAVTSSWSPLERGDIIKFNKDETQIRINLIKKYRNFSDNFLNSCNDALLNYVYLKQANTYAEFLPNCRLSMY